MATRVLVPSGVLGLGFQAEALQRALDMPQGLRPDIICIDGGSTDSGPHYLGTATSKYSYSACKSEWRQLMLARAKLEIPLVITSCGTCGTDNMVDWMLQMTTEIASELNHQMNVALLYCEQRSDFLTQKLGQEKIAALMPDIGISKTVLESTSHCVALGGAEQIAQALSDGADIVLAGRCTDTASIAALPIARGENRGSAWHAAKIVECGALCSDHPTSGVVIVEIDESGFTVAPLAKGASCTPHSVSAHMLYENSDPFVLYEPGGVLDVSNSRYREAELEGIDTPAVRVEGSLWQDAPAYTVKLEGAVKSAFQVTQLVMLREQSYVRNARAWVERLEGFLHGEINHRMQLQKDTDYTLQFRLIGIDSVLGELENKTSNPVEVGVMSVICAQTAELAEEVAKLANPFLLHYPLTDHEELPTFAFPYSPAESMRGELYEFCLNHVVTLDDPMQAFRLENRRVGV